MYSVSFNQSTILRLTNLVFFTNKCFFLGWFWINIPLWTKKNLLSNQPSVFERNLRKPDLSATYCVTFLVQLREQKGHPNTAKAWYVPKYPDKNVTNLPYYGVCVLNNAYISLTVGNRGDLTMDMPFFWYVLLFKVTFFQGISRLFIQLFVSTMRIIIQYLFRENFTLYNEHLTPTAYIPSA